jgi:hypothetical protein
LLGEPPGRWREEQRMVIGLVFFALFGLALLADRVAGDRQP